jgi:hypothetical protein
MVCIHETKTVSVVLPLHGETLAESAGDKKGNTKNDVLWYYLYMGRPWQNLQETRKEIRKMMFCGITSIWGTLPESAGDKKGNTKNDVLWYYL